MWGFPAADRRPLSRIPRRYPPVILILSFKWMMQAFYPDGVDLESLSDAVSGFLSVVGVSDELGWAAAPGGHH